MKRWKNKLTAALLTLGSLSGCTQKLYMTPGDHKAVTAMGLPKNLETDPNVVAVPTGDGQLKPRTVDDPDRPVRYMTMAEAIAIALESGNRGSQAVANSLITGGLVGGRAPFAYADDLVTFSNGVLAQSDDAIRAFALDPAVVGTNIEGALAKFDTRWITSMTWQKVDTATANVLNNFNNGDTAQFSSGLFKPLPTGGLAGITYNTNYTKLASPPSGFAVINPAYQPSLNFSIEQPLLRDYGIEMNQLLAAHPGSLVTQNIRPSGGRSEGILVTRIRFEQQRADFERTVNVMLFNVENAYWALYASYFSLYAAEQGLRQAYITWQLTKSELDAGKKTAHEVAQVRAQFANFERLRIDAVQNVLENEREFRGLLGLPVEDGQRIVPADTPTLARFDPDYNSSLTEALANRPELLLARQEVRARQLDVMLQANGTRPDLRFFANYNVNSIGTHLDGTTNNAMNNLADNRFNNWSTGLRLDVPIGTRDAHSSLRASELNLARSFVLLKNQELKANRFLLAVYQNLFRYYKVIEATRERRIALANQLKGLYARIQAGKDPLITILTAQSDFATALSDEYSAIANYNIALAGFQYAKGTLMQYDNVHIADGQLPACTLARATEHERQRTAGIVARERAIPPSGNGPQPLPSLLEHQPPTPDIPPELKNPGTGAPADLLIPERPTTGAPAAMPNFRTMPGGRDTMPTPAPTGTLPPTGQPLGLPANRNPDFPR